MFSCRKAQRFHLCLGQAQSSGLSPSGGHPSRGPPSPGQSVCSSEVQGQREGQILPQVGATGLGWGRCGALGVSAGGEGEKMLWAVAASRAPGVPRGPNPPVQRAWQVSAQPSRAVPFVLLHLHSDGVELPLAPALRIRVGDGLDLPRGRGRALEGSPETAAQRLTVAHATRVGSEPARSPQGSPPERRWTGATSSAEPSSSALPGRGWP